MCSSKVTVEKDQACTCLYIGCGLRIVHPGNSRIHDLNNIKFTWTCTDYYCLARIVLDGNIAVGYGFMFFPSHVFGKEDLQVIVM